MLVRDAQLGDVETIREIYNHAVRTSVATFDLVPRTPEQQLEWFAKRQGAYCAKVACADDGSVVGFASLSPYRERAGYTTTCEDSIYIREDYQGQGAGKLLLGAVVQAARLGGFHAVMAKIVGSHDASIALHKAIGFEIVGREREVGRKFGRWLDVVLMELLFDPQNEPQL